MFAGRSKGSKNYGVLFLFILGGIVLGGFLGRLLYMLGEAVPAMGFLTWFSYGKEFGMIEPFLLDLEIIKLQFACSFKFTVSGIIGIIIAFLIYRKVC